MTQPGDSSERPPSPHGDVPPDPPPQTAPTVSGEQPLSVLTETERELLLHDVPGYRLVRQVGAGGQGTVWLAIRKATNEKVALKFSHASGSSHTSLTARFEQERRTLKLLRHPGIVRVIEGGTLTDGRLWTATAYVSGKPLHDYIDALVEEHRRTQPGGHYPLSEVTQLFIAICEAMQTAHHVGVLHRDLKPSNILVRHDRQPVIVDFGLARAPDSDANGAITLTGQWMGTPRYASPEQVRGEPSGIDQRSDIYSLGVTLYHAVTGQFPYNVEAGEAELFDNIRFADPVAPHKHAPHVGRELSAVIMQMLTKRPEDRYPSMQAVRDDLQRFLDGAPVHAVGASRWYRMRKFVSRHRVLTASVSVALVLSLGFGFVSFGLYQEQVRATTSEQLARGLAENSQREAEQARQKAEAARRQAEEALYAYGARGDWERVLVFADQALEAGADRPIDVELLKLTALEGLYRFEDAKAFAETLANKYRQTPHHHRAQLAYALLNLSDLDEREYAIADIQAAIASGTLPPADAAYAQAMLSPTVDEMLVHLEEALRLDPFHIRAWNILIFAQFAAGHVTEALDSASRLSSLYPKDLIGHVYVALLATLQDRPELADRALAAVQQAGDQQTAKLLPLLVQALRELRHSADNGGLVEDNEASGKLARMVNEISAEASALTGGGDLVSGIEPGAVFKRLPPALADSVSGIFSGCMKLLFLKNYAGATRDLEAVANVTNEGVTLILVASGYIFLNQPEPAIDALQRALKAHAWIEHRNIAGAMLIQIYGWDALRRHGKLTPDYEHAAELRAVYQQLDHSTLTNVVNLPRLTVIIQDANLIGAHHEAQRLIETVRQAYDTTTALDLEAARAQLGLGHPIAAIRLVDQILANQPEQADARQIRHAAVINLQESSTELLSK